MLYNQQIINRMLEVSAYILLEANRNNFHVVTTLVSRMLLTYLRHGAESFLRS